MHVESPRMLSAASTLVLLPLAAWALFSAGVGLVFHEQVAVQLAVTELAVLVGAAISGLLGVVLLTVIRRLRAGPPHARGR